MIDLNNSALIRERALAYDNAGQTDLALAFYKLADTMELLGNAEGEITRPEWELKCLQP